MRNYFKYFLLSLVFSGYFSANAAPVDDFFGSVKTDDYSTVQKMLARGFDPNTKNADGQVLLYLAIREPAPNVAKTLMNSPKTNLNARNKTLETPLMIAALSGQNEFVDALIKRNGDVNSPGWTPLHYAATKGHIQVMKTLLDNYAYIDAQSPNKTTPLMMAAMYGTPEAVQLLLDEGADPLLKNEQNMTAVDFALKGGRQTIAESINAKIKSKQPKGIW